jgi:hypothetical protein
MIGEPGITQIAPIAREIIAQLKLVVTPYGIDVVDEYIGAGEDIGRMSADKQSIVPTAVLEFGEPDVIERYEDIVYNRGQLANFPFTVLCLSNDGDTGRVLRDCVVDALEGFAPTDCGNIRKLGSSARLKVTSFLSPLRFAQTIGFVLPIGTVLLPSG